MVCRARGGAALVSPPVGALSGKGACRRGRPQEEKRTLLQPPGGCAVRADLFSSRLESRHGGGGGEESGGGEADHTVKTRGSAGEGGPMKGGGTPFGSPVGWAARVGLSSSKLLEPTTGGVGGESDGGVAACWTWWWTAGGPVPEPSLGWQTGQPRRPLSNVIIHRHPLITS